MPELLDDLNVAGGCGTFRKTIKSYQKVELLIFDGSASIRTRNHRKPMICLRLSKPAVRKVPLFLHTMSTEGWYERINPDPTTTARYLKQSWIASFTMPMTSGLAAKFRCGNGATSRLLPKAVQAMVDQQEPLLQLPLPLPIRIQSVN